MRIKQLLLILALLIVIPIGAQVSLIKETEVTNEALHFWYPNEARAYIYAATISPRGDCFTVSNGYIYVGWYKGGMDKRNLMLSRKKIGENRWKTIQFTHKNTLIVDPKNKTGPRVFGNTHQTITVAVSDDDGKVHILFDHHNDPLNYIVSKANIAFASDADFKLSNFERKRNTLTDRQSLTITYPEINKNDKGELILNYRRGNSHGGSEFMHVYSKGKWSKAKRIVQGYQTPVPANKNNYAYGSPTYSNGRFYYAFSVRWDNNRSINEGVYVADAGTTMTGNWRRIIGDKSQTFAPSIRNYSPFLIDDPASLNNEGSNGIPKFAINDNGDMQIGWKSRGKDKKYFYTYTKKKNDTAFVKHNNIFLSSFGHGNKFFSVSVEKKRENGRVTGSNIVVKSNKPGNLTQTSELEIETQHNLGEYVQFTHDGVLYLMFDVREESDKHKMMCYEIKLGAGSTPNTDTNTSNDEDVNIADGWFRIKNIETGRYLRAVGGENVVAASVTSGVDKHWRFVKTKDYYNIDSRTTGDGSGILRVTNNTIIGTKRSAPLNDIDKVWKINKVSVPKGAFRIELRDTKQYLYNETSNNNKDIRLSNKIGDRSKWVLEAVSDILLSNKNIEIASKKTNESIAVYPNPAKSGFTISLNGFNKAEVIITNLLGKVIYRNVVSGNYVNINRNNRFTSGMYLIKVISANQTLYNTKLIIE